MKNKTDINSLISLIKGLDYSMLNDAEWDEVSNVDVNDEGQLLILFNRFVSVEYESMDLVSREIIRNSLIDALSSPEFNFDDVLNRVEMPFVSIKEKRLFFLTLWKAIFKENFE